MAAVFRAVFGYCFLVLVVRVLRRRPGTQMTPFEFVLIFFVGGLTLTAMVGDEVSLTNAICQIITVAIVHYLFVWIRSKSSKLARIFDGLPLVLLEKGRWRSETLSQMRIFDDDVMAAARSRQVASLDSIEYAVLERNGEISIIESNKE
jgi:uncharacterized membrane protein YcaP (DUF421 family)